MTLFTVVGRGRVKSRIHAVVEAPDRSAAVDQVRSFFHVTGFRWFAFEGAKRHPGWWRWA